MQNHKIIIGIGGNLNSNDGTHPIKVAMKAIRYFNDYSIKVTDQSSWYETEPIPKSEQPNFFNCVVFANTNLNELDVLKSLHEIEYKLGRRRRVVNEARVIDLDLIDSTLLNEIEKEWLNKYHSQVYEKLESFLGDEERNWLKRVTLKI